MTIFTTRPMCRKYATLRLATALTISIAAILSFAPPGWAGSIFDDDYTPPKRVEPAPTPSPSPSPSVPSDNPKPVPPAQRPDVAAPTPSPEIQSVHRSIPDKASRSKYRALFEEVYAKELKDRTADGRRKLAQALLAEAGKAAEGSPDRFVLLNGAMQAAEEARSLRLCFAAATQLAKQFDVDELAAKSDAVTKTFAGAPSAALSSVSNIEALFDIANQLAAEEDFATLAHIESALQQATPLIADPDLKSEARNQIQEMTALRETALEIAPALAKLKTSPDDPGAGLAVGSYLCFQRGQWGNGLPLLARSNDPAIKPLAAAELARPTATADVVKLADEWFALASRLPLPNRAGAMAHVADLYRSCVQGTTGLRAAAIQKRIAQIQSTARRRRIDLLDMFDPAASVVRGDWKMKDGILTCEPAGEGRVEFGYEPPEEYDFIISFSAPQMNDSVCQICYSAGHQFMFVLAGWGNVVSAFDIVRGAGGRENETGKRKKHWLNNAQHYVSVVKIRKGGAEAFLDGQLLTTVKTDYSDMGLEDGWKLKHGDVVGVGAQRDMIGFDAIEIVEITGEGKMLSRE